MSIKRVIYPLAVLTVLVLSAIGVSQQQNISDAWKLRNYEPAADIVQLASSASFNDTARRLFYVHDPELLDKQSFSGKCLQTEETIVLGCYITDTKIYILDVNDERLQGVEEVTAAHEMLHAVYDRLSESERATIDRLTAAVYAESTDERLKETIQSYARRDESVVQNELHSILGTEIRELPEELENHYAHYFLNRQNVVSLAEQYAQEFSLREDTIKQYDLQLEALDSEIDAAQADIEQLESALNGERAALEALRGNPADYNARVPYYNDKVRDYNLRLQELKSMITQFNELVEARNAIATEERTLLDAIDTRPSTEE